jgi:hypothetical protein
MDHVSAEIIDGSSFAIDVPYLSVNLKMLKGPSIEQTMTVLFSSVSPYAFASIVSSIC